VIGELIEHYRIQEVVGCGGMGVVYRALDENLERTVAVKVLGAEFREDREFVERFRQEARVQAALNHPNIATLFDFFIWNALPVAVMEFIEGETLRCMVDRCGPIPAHIALPIFIQALRGVAAGHKRGIIHRDLKPGNLMITHEGIVKVTDFGIAKVQGATGLTQVSTRVGSASYMAPEQILGRPVDTRTDIYVMGGTLYELLCGRPPFRGVSQFEVDSAHVRDPPEPPTAYYPHIPPAAVEAVMRALAKEPSERFATAEEFIQALPDLHGVPYVTAETGVPSSSSAATMSETRPALPDLHVMPYVTAEAAMPSPSAATTLRETRPLRQSAPKSSRMWRVAAAIGVGSLLVTLSIVSIVRYAARQASTGPDHGHASQLVLVERPAPTGGTHVAALPDTAVIPPQKMGSKPAEAPSPESASSSPPAPESASSTLPASAPDSALPPAPAPALKVSRDLTGMWTGAYLDGSGRAQLEVVNLQMRQVTDGAITGRFTYKAASKAGEECTLEKSTYSTQSKRLRLIVHCHNPSHPKYLNVPLEFTNVDPRASSLEGGRLAFHLADDIVVMLKRTKGV
jgi:serine/threonine protein kinase